jgi:hypothetical protein
METLNKAEKEEGWLVVWEALRKVHSVAVCNQPNKGLPSDADDTNGSGKSVTHEARGAN